MPSQTGGTRLSSPLGIKPTISAGYDHETASCTHKKITQPQNKHKKALQMKPIVEHGRVL